MQGAITLMIFQLCEVGALSKDTITFKTDHLVASTNVKAQSISRETGRRDRTLLNTRL